MLLSVPIRLCAFLACFAIAACTGPTPYQAAEKRDGYTDTAIEADRYRVSFSGNTVTDRETVETYLLYRAAELTLAKDRDWFRIADQDTEIHTRYRNIHAGSASFAFGPHGFGPYGFGYRRFGKFAFSRGFGFGIRSLSSRPINRYEAFANIVVFSGDKPADDASAYDARSLIETLGPKIIRPDPSEG